MYNDAMSSQPTVDPLSAVFRSRFFRPTNDLAGENGGLQENGTNGGKRS